MIRPKNCPICGGELGAVTIGWKCKSCKGIVDMNGDFHEHVERPFMPPQTNADRIRAMSDEELVNFISDVTYRVTLWGARDVTDGLSWLDWLRAPACKEGE